jgi:hypothetical protein
MGKPVLNGILKRKIMKGSTEKQRENIVNITIIIIIIISVISGSIPYGGSPHRRKAHSMATSWKSRKHSCFVYGRSRVQISVHRRLS